MDADQIVAVILFVVAALVCLMVWGFEIAAWRELKAGPPAPHDPASYFDAVVSRWARGPMAVHDWLAGGPYPDDRVCAVDPVVAELVELPDGSGADETGTVPTALRLRLPDGERTTIRLDANDAVNLRPGTFLPVYPEPPGFSDLRGNTWRPAWHLDAVAVARVMLGHRRALGLLDDGAEELLRDPRPERFPISRIRPTGTVRAGQVEVVVTFMRTGSALSVRGFLRPEEIAAVRHSGDVVVTELTVRRSGRDGRWALWPMWF
ncbi:hypothetical protein KVF89_23415 [Nocardioides carbamazepini]|uniref:hypothetical protein n=1 Tax=Nocardioides carbamazepini TaxID=2854259 RepID=UPI002149C935|nr:hypothetical protein [Nocardioides carbamazepini]MCR1785507.1 hypothetical protein [Nocardioides carbamazepini]